ncbi:hypothetical protein [Photobacterium lipolyticum]|uniref:hypothetical protein n=1 Tax=Photobacterium lipolyticum TaxID=266810 RepID=UPI0014766D2A|nr:hypothetical protein [Photobacterium lipolyticum]
MAMVAGHIAGIVLCLVNKMASGSPGAEEEKQYAKSMMVLITGMWALQLSFRLKKELTKALLGNLSTQGGIYFTTDRGNLYRIEPDSQ